ncbi:MAG: class I SAM-dependent methyltransferase [Turneriella sp.]|nr:class I SAM-dependent methyltransferase [Turneriella sp.]
MKKSDKTPNVFTKAPGGAAAAAVPPIAEILKLLSGIPGIDEKKAGQIRKHWLAMNASEDRADLTRLESPHDIALKHYLDCALPLKFIKLPSPLLDIGSGAGFPGLVLKILSPETEVILGEVRPKRTRFLEAVIADLGLTGISVFAHRIGPQFPLEIQGVVTRALESARDTLYRVQPFLPKGGRVILLKGPRGDDEVAEAVGELTDFVHEKTYSYRLGNSEHDRRLVVYRRERESVWPRAVARGDSIAAGQNKNTKRRLEITSRANEQFKMLLSLGEARGIRKEGRFIVSGQKLIHEILASPELKPRLKAVITEPALAVPAHDAPEIVLAPALFRELDFLGTKQPLAVMEQGPLTEWQAGEGKGLTVFIPFQDPGNVGAAIRSAAAFGVRRVVLLREAASPFLPKAARAAANAIFRVELLSGPSLDELIQSGEKIYRLDLEGAPIDSVDFPTSALLLPGIEGYGFRETGSTIPVRIPISGGVESLNAQSALSIALYEIARKQKPIA